MPREKPRILLDLLYYESAQEYLRSLPLEHFMEAVPQAVQRKIFVESMDIVHEYRPDVQTFNELLVQYPVKGLKKPKQVLPDNMVVVHDQPIVAEGSFDVPLQPVKPLWMLEYVSRSNKRKDYDDNMKRYEHELKIPYYLLFQPNVLEMTLYKMSRGRYVSVKPNREDRYPLPELDMEVAMVEDWVRFWFRGKLLPLPGELLKQVTESHRLLEKEQRRVHEADSRARDAEEELARLRRLLDQSR